LGVRRPFCWLPASDHRKIPGTTTLVGCHEARTSLRLDRRSRNRSMEAASCGTCVPGTARPSVDFALSVEDDPSEYGDNGKG
jgi:hypothetical protein